MNDEQNSPTLTEFENCQLLETMATPERLARFNRVLEYRTMFITLVLDQMVKEHNIAAITRTADAFGLATLHYVGPQIDVNTGISMGTNRWVELHCYDSPLEAISHLKSNGYQIAVLGAPYSESMIRATSITHSHSSKPSILPIEEVTFEQPTAIVIGNEKNGASAEFAAEASFFMHIPMCGFVESLNASVAAGICLYSALTKIRSQNYNVINLSQKEKEQLKLTWLKRDIAKKA